uniref:Uncharacterized protein n=1 Tax=Chromera velia CCMP2878 TaxID=1169474 RepID=A0A0G4I8M1_9ALVE|eukprot:Cvel_2006.t1-p1 / transcript=Cvel_2006.t1 / gene=Cvel_2006 / organism=Chromera_velia_CCMP2878 / gene_product=hypothetical protein / transcript_product=hypothetical protein / location=Cvel_scaffold76:136426-144383(+) / protein_length=191 / sequence_SO=supercontig / SO=protein_coding / is_pseudo=false
MGFNRDQWAATTLSICQAPISIWNGKPGVEKTTLCRGAASALTADAGGSLTDSKMLIVAEKNQCVADVITGNHGNPLQRHPQGSAALYSQGGCGSGTLACPNAPVEGRLLKPDIEIDPASLFNELLETITEEPHLAVLDSVGWEMAAKFVDNLETDLFKYLESVGLTYMTCQKFKTAMKGAWEAIFQNDFL